jgi:hypothetical protein
MAQAKAGAHPEWEDQILKILDKHAVEGGFPVFKNLNFDFADARITVFRNTSEWILVFEIVALSNKPAFVDLVYGFGNKLKKHGINYIKTIIPNSEDAPIWDDARNFLLDKYDFKIEVNGEKKAFNPTKADYRRAGLDAEDDTKPALKILRMLADIAPSSLFLSDKEILKLCGRGRTRLTKFLQIDDWWQPNVDDDEKPSDNPCFRALARAIAQANPELYRCPRENWNTHWSNWQFGVAAK